MSKTLEVAVFLSMNGKAQDAINFYKKHFNAEQLMVVTYLLDRMLHLLLN